MILFCCSSHLKYQFSPRATFWHSVDNDILANALQVTLRFVHSSYEWNPLRQATLWSATLRSQCGCTLQHANSNRMFSLEVRLENNLTRTHPTIENSVCNSSLSVINNGVTFITEIYGVLPIIRRETHFARNKSVCERSDGCCGLHSQLHRLLWACTDAPRWTRINLDDLRRLVEVICTTLNIRLFLLWLPYFFLDPFITVTGKNILRSNEF